MVPRFKPEDHLSCIAHLSAEDILKPAVIEEKNFKNIAVFSDKTDVYHLPNRSMVAILVMKL